MANQCFNDWGEYGPWEFCEGAATEIEVVDGACDPEVENCDLALGVNDLTNVPRNWTVVAFINLAGTIAAWYLAYIGSDSIAFSFSTKEDKAWTGGVIGQSALWTPIFFFGLTSWLFGGAGSGILALFGVLSLATVFMYVSVLFLFVMAYLDAATLAKVSETNTLYFTLGWGFFGAYFADWILDNRAQLALWKTLLDRSEEGETPCDPKKDIECWGNQLYEECELPGLNPPELDPDCEDRITDECLEDEACAEKLNDYINAKLAEDRHSILRYFSL